MPDSIKRVQELTRVPDMGTDLDTLSLKHRMDSLRQWQSSLDTLQLKQSLDSLRQLQSSVHQAKVRADSIQNLLDVSARANRQISEINQTLNQPLSQSRRGLQQEIHKVSRPEGLNQDAMAELKQQSGLEVNTALPGMEGVSLPGTNGGGSGISLPGMEMPGTGTPGVGIPEAGFPGTNLPEMEGLAEIQENIGKIDAVKEQAEAYSEDISSLSEGKLQDVKSADKIAEQQLLKSETGQAFQEQAGISQAGMGEMEQMSGRDYLKEKGEEVVYEAATDHFAGQSGALKSAQQQMTKYKGRFEKVESVKEMPKGFFKLNPLKEKPWQERILIGTLWQFGKQEKYFIDLGPTFVWRFTDRISAGGGYQYRLSFRKKFSWIYTGDKVYGYHFFADYGFKKGFFARLNYEDLNTAVPSFNSSNQTETTGQEWVKGVSAGIGKNFSFYKSIQCYSLLQYNFLHSQQKTPYKQPLQAKIGFYINGKHLMRKKEEEKAVTGN